ncbi:MAG: hypothetical protein JWN78_2167 [Bacteroidota bacterium]|nr:hypothetical protein [Bacteroidota bacterium]
MLTNTDFNVPEYFDRHAKQLFWLTGLLSVVFFIAGIYFGSVMYFAIPFVFLFAALTLFNFRLIFFIMLLVLPVSVEAYIGSFGTDLPSEPIVIMLAGCTLLYLIFYKSELNSISFKHSIFIIILLQLAWSILVTVFSTDIALSVKYVLAKSWYLLGFFILPIILIKKERSFRLFFWCLFIPTFFCVIFILIKHATLKFTFDNIQNAVYPIFRNHVNYAVFITMMLPFIFLARTWYPENYVRRRVLNYAIPFFLAAIYFSFTRGAWLATGAMLLYYMVLRFNLTKYVLATVSVVVIVFSIYILSNNNYLKYSPDYEHTIYHDELSEHLTSTFEMEDMSTVERFYRWIAAVKLFKENPVVGVGPNNFVTNYKKYTVTAYETYISDNEERSTVHNYFLLLLTEQGLPALLLFIVLIIATLLTAQRAYNFAGWKKKKYIAAVTLCIVAFLLNNTLSDLVEANKVGSLFLMSLALLINLDSGSIEIEEKK